MSGNSSSTVSSGKGNTLLSDKQKKGRESSGNDMYHPYVFDDMRADEDAYRRNL